MIARRTLILRGGAALAALPVLALPSLAAPPAKPPAAPKPRAPATFTVTIRDMAFGPLPVEMRVGDTIIWANADIFVHTATARDKSFDVLVKPAKQGQLVLSRAGQIPFYCRFHPGMKGVLVVAP